MPTDTQRHADTAIAIQLNTLRVLTSAHAMFISNPSALAYQSAVKS